MKRQVRQYEYVCDGMTMRAAKCPHQVLVTAYDSADADYRVSQIRDSRIASVRGVEWSQPWSFTPLGWLCPDPHRDDPRLRFQSEEKP